MLLKRISKTCINFWSRFPLQVLAANAQKFGTAGIKLQPGLIIKTRSAKLFNITKPTIFTNSVAFTLLSLLLLSACSSSSKIANREPDPRGFLVKIGDKAPNFSMQFTNGTEATLKDYKGKPVMLQFTASWCSVCIKEMPHIENEIWQTWKDKGLVVIGVDRDEPLEKAELLIEKTGVTYPIALDPGAEIYQKYAAKKSGVTRNVIIDKNGEIVFLTRLFNLEEFDAMKQKIETLL